MSSDGDADGDTIDAPESDALSPYTLQREEASETRHAFWADTVADRVAKRNPDEPIVIKGGISPSGVPTSATSTRSCAATSSPRCCATGATRSGRSSPPTTATPSKAPADSL